MTQNTFERLDPSLTTLLDYQDLVNRIREVEKDFLTGAKLFDISFLKEGHIDLFMWCDISNVFQLMNREFIEAIADEIKKIDPEVILEVGAGRGLMGKYLSEALDREIILTDDHSYWANERLPHFIKRMDYRKAIQTYNPDLVLASWIPYDGFWTGDFRNHPSVKGYILIGERPGGATGSEKDFLTDWEMTRLGMVEKYSVQRTDIYTGFDCPISHAYAAYFRRPQHYSRIKINK